MNLPLRQSAETLAMLAIGDGLLTLTQPRRHMRLWRTGPRPLRRAARYFEERPRLAMALGATTVAAGVLAASRLRRD